MINNSIDTKAYILLLENKEYELIMTLFESVIEFKLVPKKLISDFYYAEKFDLSTINEKKYLIRTFDDLKMAFTRFDSLFNNKKVKLIRTREDTINLNFKINIMEDDELETNLELKQIKIDKEEGYLLLSNKINEMSKKIDLMFEDYLKRKQEEEIKKKEEEEKQKKEELIRQEEEKKLKLNDNVNLNNDFQSKNIDMEDVYSISNLTIMKIRNSLAVYPIIRNNERLYELACYKLNYFKNEKEYFFNIVIYNILLNKKTNEIYNAHVIKDEKNNNIKHYYYSSKKKHFLLSSTEDEIKLWNISSKIITNELKIYDHHFICSCLLFNNDDYIILSGTSDSKNCNKTIIFNNMGNFQSGIEKSALKEVNYIEASYIRNKSYVLLAGLGNAESYDYNNNKLTEYKCKNGENQNLSTNCINLFKKNNSIYLITGYSDGRVAVFDFSSAEEKFSIELGDENFIYGLNGLCSLNEKYFLVGINKKIKVIDFDKRMCIKYYFDLSENKPFYDDNNCIQGLEKIKIPYEGEFIISYSKKVITLWKINNLNN